MLIKCIPVLLFLIPGRCSGWGILSIRLVSYKNPNSLLFGGECCDTQFWCTTNNCENYFKFCVTSLGSLQPCNLGSSQTKVLGDDDFQFPGVGGSLGNNLVNPLTYNFTSWKGSTVVVDVWDDDTGQIAGSLHDFVDKYTLTITRSADPDLITATQEFKNLCGQPSCMRVTVTLYCGANYLVPDCSMYCMSRNDSLGHYQCNFTAGRKECLDGWYDPLTDCVKEKKVCTPRNDSLGHYNCDPVSGEILCLDGWTGNNCTEACPFSSCDLIKLQSTTSHISQRPASSHLITPLVTTLLLPHTTTYPSVAVSATEQTYESSSYFTDRQSTVLQYASTHSASSSVSLDQRSSITRQFSVLQCDSDSMTVSVKTIATSYQTPTLELLTSLRLPSSSSSSSSSSSISLALSSSSSLLLVSSSSLSSLSTPSPSSSWVVLQTSSYGSFLPPTSSLTTQVASSSLVPTPSAVSPTDGIEIEMKPLYNWTRAKEDQVRLKLVNKVNEFCAKQPLACQITPNTTVNRTIFNMSHIIMGVTNGSDGKVWVRVKMKLPDNVPHIPGTGYLPSVVLKRVVLENKSPLEKSLGTQIVTVKEVVWKHPTLPPIISTSASRSTQMTTTVTPTTLGDYYSSFLPYVLVALCLTAAGIVGFAFYRRSKLREARVQPEPECPSEEELLVLPARKLTLVRPCSAPNDTSRKEKNQNELKSSKEDAEGCDRGDKYLFRSEPRLRGFTELDVNSINEDIADDNANKNIFLSADRLRELTEPGGM